MAGSGRYSASMWLLLVHVALAEGPGAFQVRVEQGAGWLHGRHVGDDRALLRGLPGSTRMAWGGLGKRGGGGVSFGAQELFWMQVRSAGETYPVKPAVSFCADLWLHVFPSDGPWFVSSRLGARLPFVVRGKVERAVVEDFYGGALALGAGYQSPLGPKHWGWSARVELEGHRLGSFGGPQGLDHSPRLDLLLPLATFALTWGGHR